MRTLGCILGFSEAQGLEYETFAEEKHADFLLTQVTSNYVNEASAAE